MDFDQFRIGLPNLPKDANGVIIVPYEPCLAYAVLAMRDIAFLTPEERDTMSKAGAQCLAQRAQANPPQPKPPQPQPKPKAPPPPRPPDLPPETAQPRIAEDSPDKLGAPSAPPAAQVTRVPNGYVNPRAPTDAVFDQKAPQAPEAVTFRLAQTTPSDQLLPDILRRLERNEPMPRQPHPSHAEAFVARPVVDGDPVDLFTGAQLYTNVDLEIPTPWIPIRMERRYRSGRPYYGPFGFGWDHSYNVALRALHSGAFALWTGALQEITFEPDGNGWSSPPEFAARLERLAGGGDRFRVVYPGGLSWWFEKASGPVEELRWPLSAIVDRHGNRVSLDYDDEGRVARVLDRAGRGLVFEYGSCGLLERVRDHTGTRVARYIHDGEREHLVQVVLPATAQYPEGVSTVFVYDADNPHPAMRHNLLRIVDAQRRTVLENEYGQPGDGWNYNAVVRQRAGDFEYQFAYEPLQYVPPDHAYLDIPYSRTSVRHPDGTLHVHTFNWRGDLLDHRYRLNRDRTARIVAVEREYDRFGNMVQVVTADGARVVFTFETADPDPCARHNLRLVELVSANAGLVQSRIVHRARFEPTFQLPIEIIDEAGAKTTLVYGASHSLSRIEMSAVELPDGTPQSSTIHLEWNNNGQPVAVVSAEGVRTEVEYHAAGPFAGFPYRVTTDPAQVAQVTRYTYDAAGFLSSIIAPGGRTVALSFNGLGQCESITGPMVGGSAPTVRWYFDDGGEVVRREAPLGKAIDAGPGQTTITDLLSRNALGHVVDIVQAAGSLVERRWRQRVDAEGRVVSRWDPAGTRTEYTYGENGALIREVRALGTEAEQVISISRDVRGRIRRIRDAHGRATDFQLDPWGRVARIDLPDGSYQELQWGRCNRLLRLDVYGVPAAGEGIRLLSRVAFDYDQRGRLRVQTLDAFDPLDPMPPVPIRREFFYDRDDRVVQVRVHRGLEVRYHYDRIGRLDRIEAPGGATQQFVYDASSDLTQIVATEPGGTASTRTLLYDGRGRLIETRLGTQVQQQAFDDREMTVMLRAADGRMLRLETDALGQTRRAIAGPDGTTAVTTYGYRVDGWLAEVTDPTGATTRWERDPLGRCRRVTTPTGEVFETAYDDRARMRRQVLPSGAQVTVRFDVDPSRPTTIDCIAAAGQEPVEPLRYAYDGLGRCVMAAAGADIIHRRYDSLGRLRAETARGQAVRMRYDDSSATAELVYPDGRIERTTHDAHGRPTRVELAAPGAAGGVVGQALLDIGYSPAGRASRLEHANGCVSRMDYDSLGRPIRIEHVAPAGPFDRQTVWHDGPGRAALVSRGATSRAVAYAFDALGRLVQSRSATGVVLPGATADPGEQVGVVAAGQQALAAAPGLRYVLNDGDGRVSQQAIDAPPATVNFTPDQAGRPTTVGAVPVAYSVDGARAADDRHTFASDVLGRICRVTDRVTGAVLAEFQYDALSRVAAGSVGGAPFERWFAGATPIEQSVGVARVQMPPHPLRAGPLAWVTAAGVEHHHIDLWGSTMAVTDAAGAVTYRAEFSEFGQCSLDPFGADLGATIPHWSGLEWLPHSTLYRSAMRVYDSVTGTFLTRDRALYLDSASPYAFAAHDPVGSSDPSGLSKVPAKPSSTNPATRNDWSPLQDVQDWLHRDSVGVWFQREPVPGDVLTPLAPVDTGSTAENYAVNTYLSLCNLIAVPINTLGNLNDLGERGLKKIGFSNLDIDALHVGNAAGMLKLDELFSAAKYLPTVVRQSRAWQAAVRPATAGAAPALPEVVVHYDPVFKINPSTSSWLRFNHEWAQKEIGYFERGVRTPDGEARRLAREWVDAMGEIDRRGENLVAMHPIDEFIGAAFSRAGGRGTTYYFGEAEINGAIVNTIKTQLELQGITQPGQRFVIRFAGFPSFSEVPPIAPYASPPNLTRQMLRAVKNASR